MNFNFKSRQATEIYMFQNLDFQEKKKQLNSIINTPIFGVNDVPYKNPITGQPLSKPLQNDAMFQLYDPMYNKFSKERTEPDLTKYS